jgi:hypothetical protein
MSDRFAEEARRWAEILGSCAVSDAAESAEMFQPYLEDMLRRARIEALEEAAGLVNRSVENCEGEFVKRIGSEGFSREEAQRFDGIITCWLNHTRAIAAAISALREKP